MDYLCSSLLVLFIDSESYKSTVSAINHFVKRRIVIVFPREPFI